MKAKLSYPIIKILMIGMMLTLCHMKSTAQSYNDYYDFLEDYYTNFVYQLPDSFERGEQTLIERDALTWAPRV